MRKKDVSLEICHIYLDLARPNAALDAYFKALAIRQKIGVPGSPPIVDVYDSFACSYSKLGDTTSAFDWLDKALKSTSPTTFPRGPGRK